MVKKLSNLSLSFHYSSSEVVVTYCLVCLLGPADLIFTLIFPWLRLLCMGPSATHSSTPQGAILIHCT